VVVPNVRMSHHIVEIADDLRRFELWASRRDYRLMHVQCERKPALYAIEVDGACGFLNRLVESSSNGIGHQLFRAADVGKTINVFGKGVHVFTS
jgi:hypothetical protein